MPLTKALLHTSPEEEKRKQKKKCLAQSPDCYFMDVKGSGCCKITPVLCAGRRARLTGGGPFSRKQH
ncbi:40S ribosomal protein S27 [Lemmus lemmus]